MVPSSTVSYSSTLCGEKKKRSREFSLALRHPAPDDLILYPFSCAFEFEEVRPNYVSIERDFVAQRSR